MRSETEGLGLSLEKHQKRLFDAFMEEVRARSTEAPGALPANQGRARSNVDKALTPTLDVAL